MHHVVGTAVASGALACAAAPALGASSANPNERACFGVFASTFAHENPASGRLVSQSAQASVPFGATVSELAKCAP